MPGQRLPVRKIRDVLRLHAGGMSKRKVAASLLIGATAAGDCVCPPRATLQITRRISKKGCATSLSLTAKKFGPSIQARTMLVGLAERKKDSIGPQCSQSRAKWMTEHGYRQLLRAGASA
jgi:hypothetical protein